METLWQILINTPWWVYLLFAYLVLIGIKCSKTNITPMGKLFAIPVIFTVLSIDTLVSQVGVSTYSVSVWAIAILVGCGLGWYQIYRLAIEADKKNKLIKVPGTWSTLIIIMIIFFSKYYFGYETAAHPEVLHHKGFVFVMLGLSGVFTGLFIGRVVRYMQVMFGQAQTNLKS